MTFKQAKEAGYKLADTRYHRGYISRRIDEENQEVMIAGGNRKGDMYVCLPCWETTQYYIRQYLTKA